MKFELQDFLPYLLNQAAEQASIGFQQIYKRKYGMLRTEWRVLFHLGRYGSLTAQEICSRGGLHKTKVSRAVSALEAKRFASRKKRDEDRRFEDLSLTAQGKRVYSDLQEQAEAFNHELTRNLTEAEIRNLITCLRKIGNQSADNR